MRLSKNVDLKREPFHLNFRKTSSVEHWEVFHSHQGIEFLYIHAGEGRAIINEQIFPIQPGTLLIFQPFQLHRLLVKHYFERTVLIFDPTRLDPYLQAFPGIKKFFYHLWNDQLPTQAITNFGEHHDLLSMYELLRQRLKSVTTKKQTEEYAAFMINLLQRLRSYELQFDTQRVTDQRQRVPHHVERIMRWVDSHFKETFQLEKLAEELHFSTYYVSHSFRKTTGSTITEYITTRRMKEACLLLETTSMSISNIAEELGFSNPSYFCKIFKLNVGMTPKQYRARWE